MNLVPVAYLTSYGLSLLGNSIAAIALPLIVLETTGSALGAGAVAAATAVPAVLAGLFVGVLIDRFNRRASSVVTDLISAASVAALPVIDLLTGLDLGWFVLFGIIGSLGDVPGLTARDALLPAIVRHSRMPAERLTGIREGLAAVVILVGPAAAGILMMIFDGSAVLWITAATSLAAALTTLSIPRSVGALVPDRPDEQIATGNGWSQLRDGWRVLLRSRFLVAVTAVGSAAVLVLTALQGLVLPVYFTVLDQPGRLGFVLTALALGLLVGAGLYAVAGTRGSRRSWLVAGVLGMLVGFALIAALASTGQVFVGAFVVGLANGLCGSLIGVLMIERIPEVMRGRVMGTQNAIMTAAPPLGIVLAAVLTEYAGLRTAAWTLTSIWAVTAGFALFSPALSDLEAEPVTPSEVLTR